MWGFFAFVFLVGSIICLLGNAGDCLVFYPYILDSGFVIVYNHISELYWIFYIKKSSGKSYNI